MYSRISDDELDRAVVRFQGGNQFIGPNSIKARLCAAGIRVQRERVRQSMKRADPQGASLRLLRRRIRRRVYHVAGPNSLWHIDGNHKLIR